MNKAGINLVGLQELLSYYNINSVFGWIDFRRGGKYRRENGVEKWVFHCLA